MDNKLGLVSLDHNDYGIKNYSEETNFDID